MILEQDGKASGSLYLITFVEGLTLVSNVLLNFSELTEDLPKTLVFYLTEIRQE